MSPAKRGPKGKNEPKAVMAVLRALDLLDAVNQTGADLRLTDLAKQTNLSKATAYRLLITLMQRELVEYRAEIERYFPGPRILEYGLRRLQGLELRSVALPYMRRLRDETQETVTMSVVVGNERQYVEQMESPQEVRQTVELGRRQPLHAGGSGKAILAFLPPDQFEKYLHNVRWEALTPQTIVDPKQLREEVARVRALAYAYSHQERQSGAASVAAPLFGQNGQVLGCLSISGPFQRFTSDRIAQFGPMVRESALAISRHMGWQGAASEA